MGKNRDKHATAEDIEAAIKRNRLRADTNSVLWGCVLSAAIKQHGHKISKRFAKAVSERVNAALPPPDAFGYWVVHYENESFGAYVSLWFVSSDAEARGLPIYNDLLRIKIGNQGMHTAHYPRQDTIDAEYIRASNPWAGAEHERAALCKNALEQEKPREWADKIKAIDEAKKALLADAGKYRLEFLLDV